MLTRLLLSATVAIVLLGIVAFAYFAGIELPGNAHPAVATLTRERIPTLTSGNQVILQAKEWNDGKVHVWSDLEEGPNTTFVDVAEGTVCDRVDDNIYMLGPTNPPISYYKVTCGEVTGYVEVDQTR